MTTNNIAARPSELDKHAATLTRASVSRRSAPNLLLAGIALLALILGACAESGGDGLADNGGMSGTGLSQGPITSFGSIFVNGVRWDVSNAAIQIDGVNANESALRVGMVVRVDGRFTGGNLTGAATSVRFEDLLEGPVENAPVEVVPGLIKTFSILGQSVRVNAASTAFSDGATYENLAANDVLEVSGFVTNVGGIRATRVRLRGAFPADRDVDRFGLVTNLLANPNNTGIFDIGTITIRYGTGTTFEGVTRATLTNGNRVKVEGTLRLSGNEIDANLIRLANEGLGSTRFDRVEIEGIAVACPTSSDFCVDGVPIDVSNATFDPVGFMPIVGDGVEVEGPLVGGVLRAVRVESEDEDSNQRNVRIEAAVTSVDATARTLLILGVTVSAERNTRIEDKSSADDQNFLFSEIMPGDFLEIRGIDQGGATVRALSIEREDATPGADDVRFEGPVTALDRLTSTLSILEQSVPIDTGTVYIDAFGATRTEDEFFRNPGDVKLGDVVRAEDLNASSLSTLGETDEMEIENSL